MKTYKVGIMGLRRGRSMMLSLRMMKDAEVPAVCEQDDEVIEKFLKEFPDANVKVYKDYDEFISSGLDGVILCNFFHEHAACAIKAFEHGVAVFSETTAAPSLGECVQLVEKCEEYNGTYMLAANCLYFRGVSAMRERIRSGKSGKVMYGEAEYNHPSEKGAPPRTIDMENLHWRQTLPPSMYNMHTLGPLMYVTNTVPRKVSCKPIRSEEYAKRVGVVKDCIGARVTTEMDNGAVFNTTGSVGFAPMSKWYRLACENEMLETKRYEMSEDHLIIAKTPQDVSEIYPSDEESGLYSEEDMIDQKDVEKAGHGGIDYHVVLHMMKVLRGQETPFLDVYRSASLSAAGILGWYSALLDGRELEIPDFTKKEDRDRVRNDFRTPFAKRYEDLQIPCRIDEKHKFKL